MLNFRNLALPICLIFTTSVWAAESALWQQFVSAKSAGTATTLPDFSYAGFDYSESEIPDLSTWAVFKVNDYGAVPDDNAYDDKAIQAAIDAAEAAGGGVVTFAAGRYMVSPNDTVGENIFINASNIVLKGSEVGVTEIFMNHMKVKNGRHIIEVTPRDLREKRLTHVVAQAERESYQIEVADASKLTVGQRILIRADSRDLAKSYYAPQDISSAWTRLSKDGFQLRELHTIAAIEGNNVTLREPLHLTLAMGEQPIEVRSYNVISNVGIENIVFKGNWNNYPETFVHHKDAIHDYAYNAIRLDNVVNSWIRNCEFKDWNQGIYIDGAAAVTIENLAFTGKKGHLSIHIRRSYGVLVQDVQDLAGNRYGPSVGYSSVGTVFLRYQMSPEQRIDSHSGSPYVTLMDGVTNGQLSGNGGPHNNYPHHGKYFVAWNFVLNGGPDSYDFWPKKRNAHTFAMPYFVGLQGKKVSMKAGTYAANELAAKVAEPLSLFEAQLALRLSKNKKIN